jgi:hypothetical protein
MRMLNLKKLGVELRYAANCETLTLVHLNKIDFERVIRLFEVVPFNIYGNCV